MKKFFSGKHKAYRLEVEVSVFYDGRAIGFSKNHPGSVSDIEIMRQMENFHKTQLGKLPSKNDILDSGVLFFHKNYSWALLSDIGSKVPVIFFVLVVTLRRNTFGLKYLATMRKLS